MNIRDVHEAGPVTYRSRQLLDRGIWHAFTTRLGGVSAAPFDSLNFGAGDDPANLAENLRRLSASLHCENATPARVRQVHGARLRFVTAANACESADADALATDESGVLLMVRVADCVPVLLAEEVAEGRVRCVAAVHAGWRGLVGGVIPAAVAGLVDRFAAQPRRLIAAIGPCISAEHYEVGSEVAQAFTACGLSDAVIRTGAKPHIDLRDAARRQLLQAGVPADRIDVSDRCTFRDTAEFFSHRRDASPGRMVAAIAMPA